MANWCSVYMTIGCDTAEHAAKLYDDYSLEKSIADDKDEGMFVGTEDRYLFFCNMDLYENTVTICGDVKWRVSAEDFEAMLNYILARTASDRVVLQYEELGCGEYGEFIYEDDKITHRYLPEDCFTDELFESELIGDELDSLLSTRAVVDVVKNY